MAVSLTSLEFLFGAAQTAFNDLFSNSAPFFPTYVIGLSHVLCLVAQSCPILSDPRDCSPPGSFVHGDSPRENTRVGCPALLQGIFPTQGSNPGLPHCRQIPYRLSLPGSHILNQKLSGSASKLAPVTHWVPIFPGGANGKESAPQCRRHNRSKFHVWVAKIPLEEGMATHSNILAQRIPWTEEPGGLQSIGLQRIRHDWNDLHAPRHPLSMTTAVLEGLQNTLHTLSYLILIKLNKVSIAFI